MKPMFRHRRLRFFANLFVGLSLLYAAPIMGEPQSSQARTPNWESELKSYSNYIDDFHAAEQGTDGQEFEATDYLQTASSVAFERMLALDFTFRTYRSISCTSDRTQAKTILQEQLYDTAFKFKNEANRIAEMLKFIKVPATAQLGLKLKDDMRATKDKLDRISASLD